MKNYLLFFKYRSSKVNTRAIKFYKELETVYFYWLYSVENGRSIL